MFNKFKTISSYILFAICVNAIGYQFLFSDMDSSMSSETVTHLALPELPDTQETYIDADEVRCMAENIYHEARGQSIEGQYAVAFVTMNRVKHVDFPNTVCDVVYEPWQFSWTAQNMTVNLNNSIEAMAWQQSTQIAVDVISGKAYNNLYGVTHYHSTSVKPDWGYQMVMQIDDHLFFKNF